MRLAVQQAVAESHGSPVSDHPRAMEQLESRALGKPKETVVLTVLESERLLRAVGSTPSAYTGS